MPSICMAKPDMRLFPAAIATTRNFCPFTTGKSTQTGKAILKLQLNLPKARVLYSSATGASEPNNLAYMIRLGTCGFKNMTELVKELNGYWPYSLFLKSR